MYSSAELRSLLYAVVVLVSLFRRGLARSRVEYILTTILLSSIYEWPLSALGSLVNLIPFILAMQCHMVELRDAGACLESYRTLSMIDLASQWSP